MFSKLLAKVAWWFVIAIPANIEDQQETFYYYYPGYSLGYFC
jgi:hypothetical protein